MNKDVVKIKKLLHLDLFTSLESCPDSNSGYVVFNDPGIFDHEMDDHHFQRLVKILGKNSRCDLHLFGGIHNTYFYLCLIQNKDMKGGYLYEIWCPVLQNTKKLKQDLVVLKEFIRDQYKKVSP